MEIQKDERDSALCSAKKQYLDAQDIGARRGIELRLTKTEDYPIVEDLTREAFWNHHVPGCDEHLLVHKLHGSDIYIPELDFVAEVGGQIVGNIVYARAAIADADGTEYEVISFGPLAVLPEYQRMGIGSRLVEYSMEEAKKLGYNAVVIFGSREYYPRFGFRPARDFGVTTADGRFAAAHMIYELRAGALRGIDGKFLLDDIYSLDEAEVDEFDKRFPPKEKKSGTSSQKAFLESVKEELPPR